MTQRYWQQSLLPEIGIDGQKKLSSASVLIVGAGGLGTPLGVYLAAMGVGRIGVADPDWVAESNLHRQFLYAPSDLGRNKSEVLAEKLSKQNPLIEIDKIDNKIDKLNAAEWISKFDLVCDCTDNVEARLLIDEVCFSLSKPLVHGAVRDWQGYVMLLNGKAKIRLTDLFSEKELLDQVANNCSINGVSPAACGVIGSQMSSEILKWILQAGTVADGSLIYTDTLNNLTRVIKIKHQTSQE